jgi:hypothetical protein
MGVPSGPIPLPGTYTNLDSSERLFWVPYVAEGAYTVTVSAFGDVGEPVTGTFVAWLENSAHISGTFHVCRAPDEPPGP